MGLEVVQELPKPKLVVFGIKEGVMMTLATVVLVDVTKRESVISEILETLASSTSCILGDTLIYTEKFDAFQIKEMSNGPD